MGELRALPIQDVRIDDRFWNRYTRLVPGVVLPYQWDILNDRVRDVPASHCLHNFRIAAGDARGERLGIEFLDSDAYKWLEAVAYSLAAAPNAELEARADEVIELIGRAQCDDGYLNTYYTLVRPQGRWQNIGEGHELYCAGHLAEAAVAYCRATGKRRLLEITCRFVDLIDSVIGPREGQLHAYPGHPELELALVRLFDLTGEARYLRLAQYFIDERGKLPNYFLQEMEQPDFRHLADEFKDYDPAYSQSHLPVRRQNTAEGHAVRAVYLYCAMADIAQRCGDAGLLRQCETLWRNIVDRRMYVTGSIGSSGFCERFTADYDLPNDSNYSETCASIGLALFGLRMARAARDAAYIDVAERALYNTVRGGIALSGDRYFYVNPLEVWPSACMPHTSKRHVKATRQKWFDVACCPTNIARTFTSLGQYVYSAGEDELFVNLFVQNTAGLTIAGREVSLAMTADYPRSGRVSLAVGADNATFTLWLRLPGFAASHTLTVNGEAAPHSVEKGYCKISRLWNNDTVEYSFELRPRLVYGSPLVPADAGKLCIVRGPEVYCFEEADNGAGLAALYLSGDVRPEEAWDDGLFGGTVVIRCDGTKLVPADDSGASSSPLPPRMVPVRLTAVPYGSWNNRGAGEMVVWVHQAM